MSNTIITGKSFVRLAKRKILKCLTQDFDYGKSKKTGQPLKRRRINQALFDPKRGYAIWSETDLTMIMDAVVPGLYFAYHEAKEAIMAYSFSSTEAGLSAMGTFPLYWTCPRCDERQTAFLDSRKLLGEGVKVECSNVGVCGAGNSHMILSLSLDSSFYQGATDSPLAVKEATHGS